jgi:phosphonate ABC transporter permease subunit PhnE
MIFTGSLVTPMLGSFSFLGYFIDKSGDILGTILPTTGALILGGTLSGFLSRLGQGATERLSKNAVRIMNIISSILAGGMIFTLIGAAINWLYEINNITASIVIPGCIGGISGLVLAILAQPKKSLSIGMVIYYLTRTILNAVRSIEALVMAIVFVIWVGIGPFAGMLALALHTVVSLAKLYSEQVESIQPGPLEAVSATGANRLQTIIYAVVPQIVPPYISYTMYRWDINVRMSTIIGFVGGGGIGFLLQQNINLLNYNAASTQMIAIAIVVASMDYISSVLREKTI